VPPISVQDLSYGDVLEKLRVQYEQASFRREHLRKTCADNVLRINSYAERNVQIIREKRSGWCLEHLRVVNEKIRAIEEHLAKTKEQQAAAKLECNALDQQYRVWMARRDRDVEEVRVSRLRREKSIDPGYKKDQR
jgi:hypothetical protein